MQVRNPNVLGKTYIHILFGLIFIALTSSQVYAKKAPDFSLKGTSKTVRLSDYKGQVVYLDFWASWCKPCRKSFPFMNELHKKYRKKGLKVIGVNLDTDYKDAQKFLKKSSAKFIIAYDPKGITPEKYRVTVMPTSYLIDRNGQILNIHKGFKDSSKDKVEAKIQKALAK